MCHHVTWIFLPNLAYFPQLLPTSRPLLPSRPGEIDLRHGGLQGLQWFVRAGHRDVPSLAAPQRPNGRAPEPPLAAAQGAGIPGDVAAAITLEGPNTPAESVTGWWWLMRPPRLQQFNANSTVRPVKKIRVRKTPDPGSSHGEQMPTFWLPFFLQVPPQSPKAGRSRLPLSKGSQDPGALAHSSVGQTHWGHSPWRTWPNPGPSPDSCGYKASSPASHGSRYVQIPDVSKLG